MHATTFSSFQIVFLHGLGETGSVMELKLVLIIYYICCNFLRDRWCSILSEIKQPHVKLIHKSVQYGSEITSCYFGLYV